MGELQVVKQNDIYSPTKEDYLAMPVGEPQNMLEARATANFLSKSKFLPPALRGDLSTAVMLIVTCKQYGLPITALSEVMEVNGKISFWGRTKLAIVMKNPLCEYIIPEVQTDHKCIICAKRKGWPKEVKEEYTIEMAEKAELLKRSDAWKKHPADMLYWKAVNRVISKVFPDIIQGFATVEEEEEKIGTVTATPLEQPKERVAKAKKIKAVTADVVKEPAPIVEETKVEEPEIIDVVEEATPLSPEPMISIPQPKQQPKEESVAQKRFRFISQVAMQGGERYVLATNALTGMDDRYTIPTADLASELKKRTGMHTCLFVENDSVVVGFNDDEK